MSAPPLSFLSPYRPSSAPPATSSSSASAATVAMAVMAAIAVFNVCFPWYEVRLWWSTVVNHEVISGGSCSAIIRHLILDSSFLFLPCSVLGFTFALPRSILYLLFLPVLNSSARSCVTISLFFVPILYSSDLPKITRSLFFLFSSSSSTVSSSAAACQMNEMVRQTVHRRHACTQRLGWSGERWP